MKKALWVLFAATPAAALFGQSPVLSHHNTTDILAERIEVLTGLPLPTHSALHTCSVEVLTGYASSVSEVEAARHHLRQDIALIQKEHILWSGKPLPTQSNRWQRFFF